LVYVFLISFTTDISTSRKNYTKLVFKLYFFNKKRLLVVFLVMVQSFSLLSQGQTVAFDTIQIRQDSLIADTLYRNIKHISSDAIDVTVSYNAEDYIKNDLINKTATLIDKAEVIYGETEIRADSIVFNMELNTVYAAGRRDSTGNLTGMPVFKNGSEEYETEELIYNFKTEKGIAKNIVTQQEDGLLHSEVTKLFEDGTSNIYKSTYSTCDADTPHFYINLPRAKVYPGKKIISGPGNLVLEGIPLPIAIPFGFFPIQTKRAASGIIIPKIGQEQQRGYSLTDGGYYFAINDYFDLSLKGNIYTNGTWLITATTNYNRLYKYSGNFSFSYANNISGHKGLPDYTKTSNYKLGWTYNQNAKARPGSRFSASVNMSSSGYDRTNSYVVNEHVTTQRQSSVSYSRTWQGTPFNLATSMNHSQNVRNKTVSLNLPKISFNVSRIYPFKGRTISGTKKWYEEFQFQYSASLDNQINTYDSLLFNKEVWNNMRNGFKHEIPVSFQLRLFKNFSISPAVTYSGVLYTQKIEKRWDPGYFDPDINKITPVVVIDTARGFFYGHAINPSISANFSPQIFGTFTFTKPDARLQAIRHVIKPSVSFSYIPSLKGLSSDMYRQVQLDSTGRMGEYSVFEGNIFGTPSLSRRSSGISFSLVNIVEAKVFSKNDTTGKASKIKLIDNFGISTSYNVFADSIKWSPVSMVMRTTIANNFNISANSSFSLYALDSLGRQTGTFLYSQNKKLMRLNNFSFSLDFDVGRLFRSNRERSEEPSGTELSREITAGSNQEPGLREFSEETISGRVFDEYGYSDFDVPWSLSIRYNLNYRKQALKSTVSQALSLNGTLSLTKKMSVNYTSGYDFRMKEITMTQIGITRDLHCWDMSFNWIPNGSMKMWNFMIRVKASVLADLKYERRKDYHDEY